MKNSLLRWVDQLVAAKERAKDREQIVGDADLAALVTEKLESAGMKKVDRGAVNHWLKGRRQPNVSQFIALCQALKVDPADVLVGHSEKVVSFQMREPPAAPWPTLSAEAEAVITRIRRADPTAQQMALAVAKAALEESPQALDREPGKNAQ